MYFTDTVTSASEYLQDNILGVPTEREQSVLDKGLPVYRSLFKRSDQAYVPPKDETNEPVHDAYNRYSGVFGPERLDDE